MHHEKDPNPIPTISPEPEYTFENDVKRLIVFNPPPNKCAEVLEDLTDPGHSLRSIAVRHSISVEALSLWLARPEVAESLAAMHTAAAQRAQLVATIQLTRAVPVLLTSIQAYESEEAHFPLQNSSVAIRARVMHRSAALRAIHLLHTIAHPTNAPRKQAPSPPAQRHHAPSTASSLTQAPFPASHPQPSPTPAPQPAHASPPASDVHQHAPRTLTPPAPTETPFMTCVVFETPPKPQCTPVCTPMCTPDHPCAHTPPRSTPP